MSVRIITPHVGDPCYCNRYIVRMHKPKTAIIAANARIDRERTMEDRPKNWPGNIKVPHKAIHFPP